MFNTAWQDTQESIDNRAQKLTAYTALDDAFISIAARIYLIRHASQSLHLQYYIWNKDDIGMMILHELLQAADRGVHIQLLIDDQNGNQLDEMLAALAQHDYISIRLFNPYRFRRFRFLDYIFRFKRINHRMHNKLILADQDFAVTGGRNISGEYFDASSKFQFTDMDIFFHGDAIAQADEIFQSFWQSVHATTIEKILPPSEPEALLKLRAYFAELQQQEKPSDDKLALAQQHFASLLQNYQIDWAESQCIADRPEKIDNNQDTNNLLYAKMLAITGSPSQKLDLISAYFIPSKTGAQFLANTAAQGIKTRILTNSFAANDVVIVHAFYRRYRKQLLQNGVALYEFKPEIARHKKTWFEMVTGRMIPSKGRSRSSLHAKLFVVDEQVFIGSFNFDPRSAHLNTEVGLVVHATQLQAFIDRALQQYLPLVAYQLSLDAKGDIVWTEQLPNGQSKTYYTDPGSTFLQRMIMRLLSLLPIEWML